MTAHRIAPIRVADLNDVTRIHEASFDDPWSVTMLRRILAMPGAGGLVARNGDDDPVLGFALSRLAGDECELLSLAVDPHHRRAGLGRLLLAASIATATAAESRALFLEVAEDNAPARALYESHGFTAVGRRPDYYKLRDGSFAAALTMRRDLTRPPFGDDRPNLP
jgi:[ribosomal protein S18]-alanine N-acetyltransferase